MNHNPETLAIMREIFRLAAMVKNPQNVPITANIPEKQKSRYTLLPDGTYFTRKRIF